MKKKNVCAITALCASLLLIGGCGKTPKLQNGQDAVVTFKDDQKISVDDLYNKMKDTYALQTLVTMSDLHILETEFKDNIDTAKTAAKNQIKAAEEQYGSEDKLLQALQYYTNYSSIDAYQEYIYLTQMQSHATEEYAKLQITDKQIKNYYNKSAVGDIEFSHILITPDTKSNATDDEKTKAETAAKNKANDLIKQLQEAKDKGEDVAAKFSELAKANSDDEATKNNGGSLGKVNKDTVSTTNKEITEAAYKLKDGEFSTELISTDLGYQIVYKTKSYDKDTLENMTTMIKEKLAKDLMSSDSTINITAMQYYRKEYKMEIQDSNLQKQYAAYIQKSIENAKQSAESAKTNTNK